MPHQRLPRITPYNCRNHVTWFPAQWFYLASVNSHYPWSVIYPLTHYSPLTIHFFLRVIYQPSTVNDIGYTMHVLYWTLNAKSLPHTKTPAATFLTGIVTTGDFILQDACCMMLDAGYQMPDQRAMIYEPASTYPVSTYPVSNTQHHVSYLFTTVTTLE